MLIRTISLATLIAAPSILSAQCGTPANGHAWDIASATMHAGFADAPERIAIDRGIACRPDLSFQDAVIEFELAPSAGGFAGIAFRLATTADYEIIYFRPGDDGRWAEAQYQPVYQGETTWQLYPGDGYQANLPPHPATTTDGWLKVRLAIQGSRADLYIGSDTLPALRVRELKRAAAAGPIALWAANGQRGPNAPATATIRALHVTPFTGPALAPLPAETLAKGQFRRWRVSPRYAAPDSIDFPDTLPSAARAAVRAAPIITAEPSGLVNLTSIVGNPAGPQKTNVFGGAGWGVAYARTPLTVDSASTWRLSLSYSDAIGVYVDGRLAYVGDNRYGIRSGGNLGVVGREAESVVLHLDRGEHEIILAVADKAFGWGFRARMIKE